MRIDINKKFSIITNSLEFTVVKRATDKEGKDKVDEDGKEILIPVSCGHCSTLPQAFKVLLDNTLKGSKAINDLQRVSNELLEMKADIDKKLETLDINKMTEEYKKYDKIRPHGMEEE